MATKQAKIPTILAKKITASRFLFSMSSCSGSDKNKNPITAADNTNRLSIVIGIIIVSFWLFKTEPTACATRTITTIYRAAPNAFKNGFLIIYTF